MNDELLKKIANNLEIIILWLAFITGMILAVATHMETNNWREEFKNEFIKPRVIHGGDQFSRLESIETERELCDFISQTLQTERLALLERLKGKASDMKQTDELQLTDDHMYDQAINDVLSLLDTEITATRNDQIK